MQRGGQQTRRGEQNSAGFNAGNWGSIRHSTAQVSVEKRPTRRLRMNSETALTCAALAVCFLVGLHVKPETVNIGFSHFLGAKGAGEIPHVDDCGVCQTCIVGGNRPEFKMRVHKNQQEDSHFENRMTGRSMLHSSGPNKAPEFREPQREQPPSPSMDGGMRFAHPNPDRVNLPDCQFCWGCSHDLGALKPINLSVFTQEPQRKVEPTRGRSGLVSFHVPMSQVDTSRIHILANGTALPKYDAAIVQVFCIPQMGETLIPKCSEAQENMMVRIKQITAVQHVVLDCGLEDIVPLTWVGPVKGVAKYSGFPVDWDGLWSGEAKGIPLGKVFRDLNSTLAVWEYVKRVNSTQVLRGAIFDFLTAQGDRHASNLFIDDQGNIQLIDNNEVFNIYFDRKKNMLNSVFLPGTPSNLKLFWYYSHVQEFPAEDTFTHPDWVMLLAKSIENWESPHVASYLDYRCHSKGGKIGSDLPNGIRQCLEKYDSMPQKDLMTHLGIEEIKVVDKLKGRVHDILELGFEDALGKYETTEMSESLFPVQDTCCDFRQSPDGIMECVKSWEPKFERGS